MIQLVALEARPMERAVGAVQVGQLSPLTYPVVHPWRSRLGMDTPGASTNPDGR